VASARVVKPPQSTARGRGGGEQILGRGIRTEKLDPVCLALALETVEIRDRDGDVLPLVPPGAAG